MVSLKSEISTAKGMKSLKEQNAPFIRTYVGGAIAMLVVYSSAEAGVSLKGVLAGNFDSFQVDRLPGVIVASIVYLLIVRLLPTSVKELLVFWRWRERLPGYRAFSRISKRDSRIDVTRLREKHGSFPRRGDKQNALWYKIYLAHEASPGVRDANQHYLLYRDLNAVNILIGLLLVPLMILLGSLSLKAGLLIFALILGVSLFLSISARVSANRLVENVLAVESATSP